MHSKEFKLPTFDLTVHQLNSKSNTVKFSVDRVSMLKVDKEVQKYKRLPERFRPALEKVGDYTRQEMIPATFKREGPGWSKLAPRTISERISGGYGGTHPILYRTGDLYKSLVEKSHPKHIEIVKLGKRSSIEVGSSSAKFIENQTGNAPGRKLPARPMIPGTGGLDLLTRDRMAIDEIVRKAIKEKLRR